MSQIPATVLRSAIDSAWSATVDAYRQGRINSEHTMQANLYMHLHTDLTGDYLVLCEPELRFDDLGNVFPDIVLVQGDLVVAVMELKFVPFGRPSYKQDLQKLTAFASHTVAFQLVLDPERGIYSNARFTVARDCLLVFAAFGLADSAAMDAPTLVSAMGVLSERFIGLACPIKVGAT